MAFLSLIHVCVTARACVRVHVLSLLMLSLPCVASMLPVRLLVLSVPCVASMLLPLCVYVCLVGNNYLIVMFLFVIFE